MSKTIKTIKAVIKKVNSESKIKRINNSLESLQKIVEGRIECVPFPRVKNAVIIVNEEGKLESLSRNIHVPEYSDILVGNIVVVGVTSGGCFCSLTDSQILKCLKYLNEHQVDDSYTYQSKQEMEAE